MSSIFPALIIPGSAAVLCRGFRGCSLTWVSVVVPSVLLSRLFWLRHSHPRRQDKVSDGFGGNTSCCWLSQRRYSAVNVKSLKDPLVVVIWPQADYLNNLLSFVLVTFHEEWDLSKERSRHPLDHPISLICEMRSPMAALFWGSVGVLPHPELVVVPVDFGGALASFRLTRRFAL